MYIGTAADRLHMYFNVISRLGTRLGRGKTKDGDDQRQQLFSHADGWAIARPSKSNVSMLQCQHAARRISGV